MIESVLTAGAAGLFATVHCAAMCGPIAVAASCPAGRMAGREASSYFAARLLAYATVGALLGTAGRQLLAIAPVGALQWAASLAVAILAIAKAASILRAGDQPTLIAPSRISRPRRPASAASALVSTVLSLLPRRGAALGAATALLPCGALVPAWIIAATSARPEAGAAAMAAFAIASSPGLVIALVSARFTRAVFQRVPARVHAAGWVLLAAWMMARALLGTACCAP